jgi:hypothetical protein
VVQEENFMVQLAKFARNLAADGDETAQINAVTGALTALRLGGVVADVYILRASNQDGSRSWPVIAFKPVHVEYADAMPALDSGASEASNEATDDIGF